MINYLCCFYINLCIDYFIRFSTSLAATNLQNIEKHFSFTFLVLEANIALNSLSSSFFLCYPQTISHFLIYDGEEKKNECQEVKLR